MAELFWVAETFLVAETFWVAETVWVPESFWVAEIGGGSVGSYGVNTFKISRDKEND